MRGGDAGRVRSISRCISSKQKLGSTRGASLMAQKNVLIVARTRMYGAKVCVGALSDQGESLRLMNQSCESDQGGSVPYRIGQWSEVDCEPCGPPKPPHVEDVSVRSAQ